MASNTKVTDTRRGNRDKKLAVKRARKADALRRKTAQNKKIVTIK